MTARFPVGKLPAAVLERLLKEFTQVVTRARARRARRTGSRRN